MGIRNLFTKISSVYYKLSLGKNAQLSIGSNSVLFAKFRVKGKSNILKFGKACTFRRSTIIINGSNNSVTFGKNVKVYESFKLLIETDNCNLLIKDNTTIGSAKFQFGEKNTDINIGETCMLSRDIIINTSDFHSIIDLNTGDRINHSKSVNIGNHVWIGNGVYINKGASINDDSIIAARSVVPGKMFEKNSIIGGVPAKVIKEKVNWDRRLL